MAIFLYRLEFDEVDGVLNHDEVEQRVRQFIRWKTYPEQLPELLFEGEELGIRSLSQHPTIGDPDAENSKRLLELRKKDPIWHDQPREGSMDRVDGLASPSRLP